jgi:hypothetical protein
MVYRTPCAANNGACTSDRDTATLPPTSAIATAPAAQLNEDLLATSQRSPS